jgi:hypothetical protein
MSLIALEVTPWLCCAPKQEQDLHELDQNAYCALNPEHLAAEISDQSYVTQNSQKLDSKIHSYLERGNLQEAIWLLEQIPARKSDTEHWKTHLHHVLTTGHFDVQDSAVGGANPHKQLLEFEHGIQALYKPNITEADSQYHFTVDYHAEVAAYALDQLLKLGIVPMTVERTIDGIPGSLQYFVKKLTECTRDCLHARGFVKMKLLDYLIGNLDRKMANFLYCPAENRIVAIDHGIAFKTFVCGSEEDLPKLLKKDLGMKSKIGTITKDEIRSVLHTRVSPLNLEALIQRFHVLKKYSLQD